MLATIHRAPAPAILFFLVNLLFPGAVPLLAGEHLDPARIQQIAAWLPDQPTGFGWPITDRTDWEQLAAEDGFKNAVSRADHALIKGLPDQPDSLYLDFSKTGNRTHWQTVSTERRARVGIFTLGEAVENRGHYLPALEETITALCAEKTWVLPAHDARLYNFNGQTNTPELGATGLAADLAEADYVLGDQLSPGVRKLIRDNVRRRVLEPFRAMVEGRQAEEFWLRAKMNWNPVCLGNTVFAALALVESRDERAFYATAGEHFAPYYLEGITPDGYCGEGVGYWNYGFGHFVMLSEALRQATGGRIDLFNNPTAIAAALYCHHSEILPGIYLTISDVNPGTRPMPQLVAYVDRRLGLDPAPPQLVGVNDRLHLTMMFSSLPENTPVLSQAVAADSPLRSFFSSAGILISRTAPGASTPFAVALKGGNNNEPHNHNDVGSFSVVSGDTMLICDPGGEVYTARTFGPHRYDSKVLSSYGHAVPMIAGKLERPGAKALAVILETNFTDTADSIKFDMRSAYPVRDLKKLDRTFDFHRGDAPWLAVRDDVAFAKPESFESALITWGSARADGTNALLIADGRRAVRVTIDTGGLPFTWHQEIIDEDVENKRKPHRIAIDLASPVSSATVKLKIEPAEK